MPTYNSNEQAIRMSTVFRKVTNCFRSDWGKDLFAAVRSLVNMGARQGLSAYEASVKHYLLILLFLPLVE